MTRIFSVIVLCISLYHGTSGVVNPSECRSLMDLFLVIDGSDSISFEDFELLRKAIGKLIAETDLGPDKARIGMLVFSSDVPAASEHAFSYDRAYLNNAAATLLHPRDGTKTGLGLNHTRTIFRHFGRPNVPWVCITITDGISKYPQNTIYEANEAAKMGISMFAVGIGHKIALPELNAIASSPKQVTTIQNFSQLQEILMQMMVTICPCPIPETYPYSKCNEGPRAIGSTRMYECEPGYMLVGNPRITCQDDFTWTPIDPSFACVPCSDTTHPIDHGFCPPGNANTIGSERIYKCHDGYRPVGNPRIQCLPDATWSMPDFRCVPCGDTPFIPNGECQPGDVTINSVRSLVCLDGYRAVGDPTIKCYDDPDSPTPIWSHPNFRCFPCASVPTFANGHCEGGDDRINSVRNLVCDPGYKPVGIPQIQCLDDYAFDRPTWSPLNFRCEPCGAVPTFAHGHCDGTDFTLNTRRQLVCDRGYRPVGNPEIVCMDDPNYETPIWSPIDFKCEPCGPVPTFENGHCDGNGNTIATRRNLVCNPGYRPIGNAEVVCLDDPQYPTPIWSPVEFQCVPCGPVPTFANGHCDGSGFTINTRRNLVCAPGYKAVGNPEIVCLDDHQYATPVWSPIEFQCVPCGDTPFIPNGECQPGDVTINSVRSLVCLDGYRAVGDATIKCYDDPDSPTPVWSHPNFRCFPCASVPTFAHGHCEGGDDRINSVRNLVCDPGYKPVGIPQITCLDDYAFDRPTWSPLNFRCEPCGAVPTFAHGHCDGTGFTLNTRRQLVCDPGYRPVGNPETVCMDDPNYETPIWSPIDFKCEPCGPVPTFDNGHCDGNGNTIATRRNLVCNPGYRPIGNAEVVCLDDPQYPTPIWSPVEFKCVPCGETPSIHNGNCGGGDFTINSVRHLTCNEGYRAVGNPQIVCIDDLAYETPVWTPNFDFRCVGCEEPPYVANAFVNPGPNTIGAVRAYACDTNYKMNGAGLLKCMEDGTWSGQPFTCDAIVTTTPRPVGPDPTACDACRFLNGVGYNSHPSDCNQYVQCFMGTRGIEPVYRRCPFGLFWDQADLTCKFPRETYCHQDPCAMNPGLVTYKDSDPNACCAYWKCESGRTVGGECCGEGYSYNPIQNRCVYDPTCTNKCPYQDEIPLDCNSQPVADPTKFKVHIGNGYFVVMDCAPGTQYDATRCDCSTFLTTAIGPSVVETCTPELHLPFTHTTDDISKNKATVNNLGVRIIDGAAYFDGNSRLVVNMFSNNEYGDHLVIKFRYQEFSKGDYFGDLQALVTNGDCDDDPSIIIAKMPGYVLMGAKADSPASFAVPTMDQPWKDVVYYKSPKTLDGNVCGGSFYDYVYGRIQKTRCALQIGYGTGLKPFHGLISDLKVYRCRPEDMLDHGPLPHRIV